jgi:uncharacterized protein (TIGR02646 family)
MRQVDRAPLPERSARYLKRRQGRADAARAAGSLDVEKEWKSARGTKAMGDVQSALRQMMGRRERCIYCLDSHGSDIEHFRPKAPFPERMFSWPNLLLCCAECGRYKGDRFPLQGEQPLLIDPTQEDPWRHIDFDLDTGNLTARYDPQASAYSRKGERTVEILKLDRREALAAGHIKTWRRLSKIVRGYLADGTPTGGSLVVELVEADDHGLLGWCFDGAGQNEPPFTDLRNRAPEVWAECATRMRSH